jgi:hypothetical protein
MTDVSTRDRVRSILEHPEEHKWQVQGFGMLRTYLEGPGEPRLQVWDQRLATWHNNAIHDHPLAFRSVIVAGLLYNQRFSVTTYQEHTEADMVAKGLTNGHTTEIIPGTRGGRLSERPVHPCSITPSPVEVYSMGDTYSQTHRELHLTRYQQGTVTLIERFDREEADMARIAWYGGPLDQPPFVNPYPPIPEQIERTLALALDSWFV